MTEASAWDFSVAPPFYRTNRFYGLVAITVTPASGGTDYIWLNWAYTEPSAGVAASARTSTRRHPR